MAKKIKQAKKQGTAATPGEEPPEQKFKEAREEIKKMLANENADEPAQPVTRTIKVEASANDEDTPPAVTKSSREKTAQAKDFAALYQLDGQDKADLGKIDRRDPNRKKKIIGLVIFILVILVGVALAGFYFFISREKKFSGANVSLEATTPKQVSSGDEITFTVLVHNREAVDLVNAELTLQTPTDYKFISSDPAPLNEANNAWSLGEIKKNSTKEVSIVAQVFGDMNDIKNFSALLTYSPANFSSEFQANKPFDLVINDSILSLDIETPVKVISGQPTDYKITTQNNSKETMEKVRVTLTLPADLQSKDFTPAASGGQLVWEFPKLASQAKQTIAWRGTLQAAEGEMREIKSEVGYVDKDGQYHVQKEDSAIIFVVNPQLVLTLSVNGTTGNSTADFGQELAYTLKYQNASQSEIKDMVLQAEMAGEALDWTTLTDKNKGKAADGKIVWDKTTLPSLVKVKPGDQGEINFSIKIKDNILAKTEQDKNYTLVSQARAQSSQVTELEGSSLDVESNSLTIKLNSRLDLRSEARYYSDEYVAVGKGPLPPQVGQTTTYQIYWYLKNSANEVKNVTVSAVLPDNVTWASDSSAAAGNISYDPTTRRVTWTVNKLPPQIGQLIPELETRLAVSVTPTVAEVGQSMKLLNETTVTANDTFTEQVLSKTQPAITTDLTADSMAVGKGLVVPAATSNINVNTNI